MRKTLAMLAMLALTAAATGALPEPPPRDELVFDMYGDSENVALLAALLSDGDAGVRERAVLGLGQTANEKALPLLRNALSDASPDVRATAVIAAAGFGPSLAEPIVAAALADKDDSVAAAALREAGRLKLTSCAPAAAEAAKRPSADVAVLAVATLTSLGAPLEAAAAKSLLSSESLLLRMAVARNMLLADKPGEALEKLRQLAADEPKSTGGEAIVAWARFEPTAASAVVAGAAKSLDPVLRSAAVRALGQTRDAKSIRPFLDDASPAVRLAAIRVAGDLKCSDCAKRILELMLATRAEETEAASAHLAARDALVKIGGDDVIRLVIAAASPQAGRLIPTAGQPAATATAPAAGDPAQVAPAVAPAETPAEAPAPPPAAKAEKTGKKTPTKTEKPKAAAKSAAKAEKPAAQPADQKPLHTDADRAERDRLTAIRNLHACCHILGELKAKAAVDTLAELLATLPTDSTPLGSVAAALGKIGDERALDPLHKLLARLAPLARKYLIESTKPVPTYVPFTEEITSQVIDAVSTFRKPQSLEPLRVFATMTVRELRLSRAAAAAVRGLTSPQIAAGSEAIAARTAQEMVADRNYQPIAHYEAARAAGRMKIAAAEGALQDRLAERNNLDVMKACAWALEQITGKAPAMPEPLERQGDWIVRKIPS
jgi:HEAT repeat protein